ncbi:MAG: hypothetical protein M3R04_02695 [bacterium]|nr:hypothetical protein [bacterium]
MDLVTALRVILMLVSILALGALAWLLLDLRGKVSDSLTSLRSTLANLDRLSKQIVSSGILDQAKLTMNSVGSGVGKIDPLLVQLEGAITEARELLDDATQTSQSVRARVDDLAAMQRELHDTSSALADVVTQLRDQQISVKVGNVLSDASTLMADIGLLAESASSVLDTGKPLVKNASDVISSAKRGVRSIASGAAAVKEGFKAGVDTLTGHDA